MLDQLPLETKQLSQVHERFHISVCICTFRRPDLLSKALNGITKLVVSDAFTYEVVVVDNDEGRSAEQAVRTMDRGNATRITYGCEPLQNIAIARNMAVRSADGDLIAFIDDDECPDPEWLTLLYDALGKHDCDGVLGPVLPDFPAEAPAWLRNANVFNRRRFATGTPLTSRDTRTGNALLRRSIFSDGQLWFDPAFGRTGGEDVDFFSRQLSLGRTFVWCDEAMVKETVPRERWNSSFHITKYLRIGATNGRNLRKTGLVGLRGFVKSLASLPIRLLTLLALLLLGKHLWFPQLLKLTYAFSCCVSYLRAATTNETSYRY